MTEYQAWRYIENAFRKGKLLKDGDGDRYVLVEDRQCYGICHVIWNLRGSGKISKGQELGMDSTMSKLKRGRGWKGIYAWSNTKSSAIARANFCAKQAKLIKRKSK